MGAELSCPRLGGRVLGAGAGKGSLRPCSQVFLRPTCPPVDPRACLRSHGASVGLSASGARLCLPNHIRAEQWAACFTSEAGGLAQGLLPTPFSPKSQLGLHLPRNPLFSGHQRGGGLKQGLSCLEARLSGGGGRQETWPPRLELQDPTPGGHHLILGHVGRPRPRDGGAWPGRAAEAAATEAPAPGPLLTAALASAAWCPHPGALPHSAAGAPGGPTRTCITPASLQTQAPEAAAWGGPTGLHWV